MKIVFMGTPDFAVGALEALLKAGHEVRAVVTQPDKQKGRDKKVQFSPVKECALQYHLPLLQPAQIRTPEAAAELRRYEADIFVVAAFGQILSKEILQMPKYGCINIHASLLPKYRGAAPIQQAILNGDDVTGVTIMQMDEGLDTGDILTVKVVPIEANDTGETLFHKLSVSGAQLLIETLPLIEVGKITPVKQDGAKATYVKMLTKEMGKIDWKQPAARIERLIRAMDSWPSAYCTFRGKTMKIWRAEAPGEAEALLEAGQTQRPETARRESGSTIPNRPQKDGFSEKPKTAIQEGGTVIEPGKVLSVTKEGVYVQTGGGILILKEVQLEGRKRLPVKEFLLGYPVKAGDLFT